MIDRDPPYGLEDHAGLAAEGDAALAAEGDASSTGAKWSPNRTAQQITARLEKEGFTVKVPDAPHGSAWELILDKPGAR